MGLLSLAHSETSRLKTDSLSKEARMQDPCSTLSKRRLSRVWEAMQGQTGGLRAEENACTPRSVIQEVDSSLMAKLVYSMGSLRVWVSLHWHKGPF